MASEAVLANAYKPDQISLIYPIPSTYLSSTKNWHNFAAPRSNNRLHAGVDISGPSGTPFVAVADGTVKAIFETGARGWCLIISHGGGILYSLYEHMENSHGNVVGKSYKQGDVCGYIGNKGDSTGPHLHFGLFTKWITQDGSDTGGMKTSPRTTLNPDDYISESNATTSTTYVPGTSEELASALSTSAQSSVYGDDGNTTISAEHQTETIRAWSSYLDDNIRKATDEYKLIWKGYQLAAYDISGRIADLQLKDSIEAACTELSFTVVRSDDDYYLSILNEFAVGDEISLSNVNTSEVIFRGTVQSVSGSLGRSIEVQCVDKGICMTKNEFLVQFHSASGEDVIATMASKAGLKSYNSPKFTSTNEQTYETSASEIVRDMLNTIKTENGITYFMRVINDCLVIRSRGKTPITPYHKPNSNTEAFPCVMGMQRPTYDYSIENMYNSVQVYQSEDSSKQIVGEASSEESIARYGKWNKLVEYSGKDPATGDKKATYELNYVYDLIDNTLSFECPGSDRLIAGVRIEVPINDEIKEYWVHEVEHSYIPTHTCKLTLVECDQEEPVYEGPDVEESTEEDSDGTSESASSTGTEYDYNGMVLTEEQWEKLLEEQQEKADEEAALYGD